MMRTKPLVSGRAQVVADGYALGREVKAFGRTVSFLIWSRRDWGFVFHDSVFVIVGAVEFG